MNHAPPWSPADYIAIGPNHTVVGWGPTEAAARHEAIAHGAPGAMIVHASKANVDALKVLGEPR